MNLHKCVKFLAWYLTWTFPLDICFQFLFGLQFCSSLNIGLWVFTQDFALEPLLAPVSGRPEHVERVLKNRYHEAMTKLRPHSKELDLLIVILPDNNGSLYGKRLDFSQVDDACVVLFLF